MVMDGGFWKGELQPRKIFMNADGQMDRSTLLSTLLLTVAHLQYRSAYIDWWWWPGRNAIYSWLDRDGHHIYLCIHKCWWMISSEDCYCNCVGRGRILWRWRAIDSRLGQRRMCESENNRPRWKVPFIIIQRRISKATRLLLLNFYAHWMCN